MYLIREHWLFGALARSIILASIPKDEEQFGSGPNTSAAILTKQYKRALLPSAKRVGLSIKMRIKFCNELCNRKNNLTSLHWIGCRSRPIEFRLKMCGHTLSRSFMENARILRNSYLTRFVGFGGLCHQNTLLIWSKVCLRDASYLLIPMLTQLHGCSRRVQWMYAFKNLI